MEELRVQGSRDVIQPRYQGIEKTARADGAAPQRTEGRADALRQLTARVSQAEAHAQLARQTLQAGEAALAEVQEGLARLEETVRKAREAEDPASVQAQLKQALDQMDRILQGGASAGLFREAGPGEGALGLPSWLLSAMSGGAPDKAALLAAMGLDASATGPEILEALGRLSLEDSPAAGYLAALYLGSVIAGGSSGELDPDLAAGGLQRFLDLVAQGASPDEALEMLTDGEFTSLSDFQEQFMGGTAPGMEDFLSNFLLGGASLPALPSILLLLGGGGGEMDLLMNLLDLLGGSGTGLLEAGAPPESAAPPQGEREAAEGAALPQNGQAVAAASAGGQAAGPGEIAKNNMMGGYYDPAAGALTLDGPEEAVFQGAEEAPALRLAGQGAVVLRDAESPELTAESPQARVYAEGESALGQVTIKAGAALTVAGGGTLHIASLRGEAGSTLRITGGAVALAAGQEADPNVQVVVDGPASLLAARNMPVYDAQGRALEPFDVLWKALLPGWDSLTALAIDGRQGQLGLLRGGQPEAARLWMLKGDPSHGYPAHTVALQGRDQAGALRTRYVYLLWSQREGMFREVSMYPNPFTVTGGEENIDWSYEEDSRTLWVLSGLVTGLSGGMGTDANQLPFCGRLALADGIGPVELRLGGVSCRVPSGRACSLGHGNRVTLLLESGSHNLFESGSGCAGISLGDGASLRIDQAGAAKPIGTLAAVGGAGSPGIGGDGGVAQGRTGSVLIRCEGVTVTSKKTQKPAAKPTGEAGGARAVFPISAQGLRLDAMDVSSREAAEGSLRVLSAGRRWVSRLQDVCRNAYDRLGDRLSGLHSVQRHIHVVRESDEADELLWGLRQELMDAPVGSYSRQVLEEVGQLLWEEGDLPW